MEPLYVVAVIAGLALLSLLGRGRRKRARRRSRARRTHKLRTGAAARPYVGDFTGPVHIEYAPKPDGMPDPGEVVWTWVAFEEDYSQGKDRPVLLIGRDGRWLLGVQLSTSGPTGSKVSTD